MDVTKLKNTPAGLYKFVKAIQPTISVATTTDDGRVIHKEQNDGPPVKEIVVEGQVVKVGDMCRPSMFWKGKNFRVFDEGNLVLVEQAPSPAEKPFAGQREELEAAVKSGDHNELGEALKSAGVEVPAKKDERLAVAKALLSLG